MAVRMIFIVLFTGHSQPCSISSSSSSPPSSASFSRCESVKIHSCTHSHIKHTHINSLHFHSVTNCWSNRISQQLCFLVLISVCCCSYFSETEELAMQHDQGQKLWSTRYDMQEKMYIVATNEPRFP